jgi:hypothetical protein
VIAVVLCKACLDAGLGPFDLRPLPRALSRWISIARWNVSRRGFSGATTVSRMQQDQNIVAALQHLRSGKHWTA